MARKFLVAVDEVSHFTDEDWAYLRDRVENYVHGLMAWYINKSSIVDNEDWDETL